MESKKIKPIKKKRNKTFKNDERACVNKLIKTLHEISPEPLYIKIDLDSKQRVFKSGWDFLISRNGKVIFCEAKRTKTFTVIPKNLLTTFQQLTSMEITNAGMSYFIIEFMGQDEKIHLQTLTEYSQVGCSYIEAAEFLLAFLE